MSTVERHKKPGGFRKLVNSLETTPPDRRKKILDLMASEDPAFVKDVQKCIFEFEEFALIDDMVIAEIIFQFKTEMKVVALALFKAKDEKLIAKFMKNMTGATGGRFNEETSMLDKITVGQQQGARYRMIEKSRELQLQHTVVIKKYNPKYIDDE